MTAQRAESNALMWARFYKSKGWQPIPVPLGAKRPTATNWPQLIIDDADLPAHFSADTNIGILLGQASGDLVDIDLDCAEALALAPYFLPFTACRFGRKSTPLSHWLYRAPPSPLNTQRWLDTQAKADSILEFRTNGAQTIFPGSVHLSGETIDFEFADKVPDPATVAPGDLARACNMLAAASLIARHWPTEGGRHHAALATAGWLLRAGKDVDEVEIAVEAIATLAGDDEIKDRVRAVRDTDANLKAGRNITGLPTLSTIFGERVAARLKQWVNPDPLADMAARASHASQTASHTVGSDDSKGFSSSDDGLAPKPLGLLNFSAIPTRKWLLGTRFVRGFITLTIAPGGVGKSTLSLQESIAINTGREITGERVYERCPTWIYNNEDPNDELHRRIAGICIKYGIPIEDIADGVYLNSGVDRRLIVAQEANGVVIATPDVDALAWHIKKREIGLLTVDPFVRCHRVNENSNDQIDFVAEQFSRIAGNTGCAINLVHHLRKPPSGSSEGHAGNADSARGAGSLVSAARAAHTLATMSQTDAKKLGIDEEEARFFVRLDDAKANLAPPGAHTVWYKRESVKLPNGSGLSDADSVGVLARVDFSDAEKKASEKKQHERENILYAIAELLRDGEERKVSDIVNDLATGDWHAMTGRQIRYLVDNAVGTTAAPSTVEEGDQTAKLWVFKSGTAKAAWMIRKSVVK
jgi:RecA-family ATPase